ncbi:MAG: peptidylprolyl isomerase [Proteobacteria bacterium]|nr:peptidylprolyl isomerase [Pseudomonadota bacterium]MBU1610240.1 peptidylprolyl isomerase [Pseudomonadota bacterium]
MNRLLLLLLLALSPVTLLMGGCNGTTDDIGVVARVNGRPIALNQLEFQHDLLHMDGAGTFVPSVEALRREYGHILADLIVLELVEQELERLGLQVTDEEMVEEEAQVRADYPDDAFDQVLIEEYIDLASWRRQLHYDKSRRNFFQNVLRPQIKIDYLEADAYYKKHLKDFRLPESYRMVVIRGAMKGPVQRAVALYRESDDVAGVLEKSPDITINELTVGAGQLSEDWKKALDGLPNGEVTPVLETRSGFEALVLLQKLPAKMLDPTQAYPLVEEALLDRKLSEAFEEWLSKQLAVADIKISALLLEKAADDDTAGVEDDQAGQGADTDLEIDSGDGMGEEMGNEDDGDDEQALSGESPLDEPEPLDDAQDVSESADDETGD